MSDAGLRQESLNEFLRSHAFRVFLEEGVLAQARVWKKELLTNVALDEAQRKAYVLALAAVGEGVRAVYGKAAIVIPEWLSGELLLDEYR